MSEITTPDHLSKSDERPLPYLYEGRIASPAGWVPHRLVVFVSRPDDAQRFRHSVHGMRVDRVAPLKAIKAAVHMLGDQVQQVTYGTPDS